MNAGEHSYLHSLDPATADERECATELVRQLFQGVPVHSKAGGLDEPEKKLVSAYLEAEHGGQPLSDVPRHILFIWYIKRTPRLFRAIVDVTHRRIISHQELPRDFHGPVDRGELNDAAQVFMRDAGVKKETERLKIDDTTVVLDSWDYGVDGESTQTRHTQVCPNCNQYAFGFFS